MIGHAHLQYHPTFYDDVERILNDRSIDWDAVKENKNANQRSRRKLAKKGKSSKKSSKSLKETSSPSSSEIVVVPPKNDDCDPVDVQLMDYPQWQAEKGYWIGEYTFMQGNGKTFVSSSWNYPYDHYKGFITGEVVG